MNTNFPNHIRSHISRLALLMEDTFHMFSLTWHRSNSHCRRFDWLIFAVFGQSVWFSIAAVDSAPTGRWPFNRDLIVTGAAGPLMIDEDVYGKRYSEQVYSKRHV